MEEKPTIIRSIGVINGKATYLPKPAYSAAAIAVNAQGKVTVQVMIDEAGKVISANAISGHPLLKSAAEIAARQAKFSPTYLSNIPVKVTGVIVYNFTK
jgi:TonB family protein